MATQTTTAQPKDDGLTAGAARNRKSVPVVNTQEYVMPLVEAGDVVLWSGDIAGEPDSPAIVTRVFNDSIHLNIVQPDFHNLMPMDGVRHRDFPDRNLLKTVGSGHWCHTPFRVRTEERLSTLEQMLMALADPAAKK